MFDQLLECLNEQGAGVRAYDACARMARARVSEEPDNAAAYLLLAYVAQRFVESYDDQPLSVEAASEEFQQFTDLVKMLDKAEADASADARIAALNVVAAKLNTAPKTGD